MNDQELFERIREMRNSAERTMPSVRSHVDTIICQEIKDEKEIEGLLDTLLNYVMLDVGRLEFEKLNRYYATVNRENADYYHRHYYDLLGF